MGFDVLFSLSDGDTDLIANKDSIIEVENCTYHEGNNQSTTAQCHLVDPLQNKTQEPVAITVY